jgi:hypothetical protein
MSMERGNIKLLYISRKALMPGGSSDDTPRPRQNRQDDAPSGPPPTMSDEEVDVIAQAIEG